MEAFKAFLKALKIDFEKSPYNPEFVAKVKKSDEGIKAEHIRQLIESIAETPFEGIGKPEALKFGLAGKWSGRINKADRIIYTTTDSIININSLKEHYD